MRTLAARPSGVEASATGLVVRIEGHASDQALSEARALAVTRWLVVRGVACERLVPVGFGQADRLLGAEVVEQVVEGRVGGGAESGAVGVEDDRRWQDDPRAVEREFRGEGRPGGRGRVGGGWRIGGGIGGWRMIGGLRRGAGLAAEGDEKGEGEGAAHPGRIAALGQRVRQGQARI
jgi:hypothetical protein